MAVDRSLTRGRLVLELGGFRPGFSGAAGLIGKFSGRYARFASTGVPDYLFTLSRAGKRRTPPGPLILERDGLVNFRRDDLDCVFDERGRSGVLALHPAVHTFDSFLRAFLSRLLLNEGGMLLHCAAIVKDGGAYLFPGKSGAGKSTLSGLAAGAGVEVISDELNIVRPFKGGVRVFGSPFWGEMKNGGRQGSWPLKGIFIIGKARSHRVLASPPGAALSVLLRCLVNFSRDGRAARAALASAAGLLHAAPVKRLEFSRMDAGFLRLLNLRAPAFI